MNYNNRNSPPLRSFFDVLATNHDRRGREFISAVEAREGLPIWATQCALVTLHIDPNRRDRTSDSIPPRRFHPEKNIFEWGEDLPSAHPHEAVAHVPIRRHFHRSHGQAIV